MAAVIPGWKLTEVVNGGEIADSRKRADIELAQRASDELDDDLVGFPELQRYKAIASRILPVAAPSTDPQS